MYTLYLDESGDHDLGNIHEEYPMFVLAGVAVKNDYYADAFTERVAEFKQELFDNTDIILHTADFSRCRNGFESLKDADTCDNFYDGLNNILKLLDYSIIACAIMKQEHFEKYGADAYDPYDYSLHIAVERFFFFLKGRNTSGEMWAETRGKKLDGQLNVAWEKIKNKGTGKISANEINSRIHHRVRLRQKKQNDAGIQIADAIASPIGRGLLKKKSRVDYKIIRRKFYKSRWGKWRGYGLKVLP